MNLEVTPLSLSRSENSEEALSLSLFLSFLRDTINTKLEPLRILARAISTVCADF